MTRPSDQIKTKRSFIIKWKGNKPTVEESHWEVGYTPGHQGTPQEALAMEVANLMQHISDFREKWLNLNLLAEQMKYQMAADAFGSLISVTETDDPHETMTMPEGALDAESVIARGNEEAKPKDWNHDGHADGEWAGDYDDHQDH